MKNILDVKSCTGCLLCKEVCPTQCISKAYDKEGFLVPKINISECVNCGLCYKKCPEINMLSKQTKNKVYAAQIKNKKILVKSSSGGIGALLSEYTLNNNGIVYGCILDDNLKPKHIRCSSIKDIEKLSGSKYVQSDISEIYKLILKDCKDKKRVLVIGTPCQIAGIRNFLGDDFENLYLVDLICHGVPSPTLFERYLKWKANDMGQDKIIEYRFREKKFGWGTTYKAVTVTATATATATLDPYYEAFIYGETYRECCYECQYATTDRVSDMTIGDYWGIQKFHPDFFEKIEDGVSVILINSDKGNELMNEIKSDLFYLESLIKNVIVENSNLYRPAIRPFIRDEFYKNIELYGFRWANKKLYKNKRFYINYIKNMIPKRLKRIIKMIIRRR